MSFDKDIKDFNKKTEKAALNVFRGTALSLFGRIVKRTPVDTGRLRGNWQASINISPSGNGDTNYRTTVGGVKLGDSIYLTNNLPYANAIENGHSKQAPVGMVRVTIVEFEHTVAMQARKNKV